MKVFRNTKNVSSKADAMLNIKRKLDNVPECAEKQKIFDALPDDIKQKLNKMWGSNYKYDNVPKTAKGQGEWVGERGNSNYKFDVNRKPISKGHDNTRNLSMEDIINENNCKDGIKYIDGYPDLSPYEIANIEMDYMPYANDLLKKNPNRMNLHEGAFKKIAKTVNIKGFRAGQAPEAMVRKMVNTQSILWEAVDYVANDALVFGVQEQNLECLMLILFFLFYQLVIILKYRLQYLLLHNINNHL